MDANDLSPPVKSKFAKRVTEDLLDRMREMRRLGHSYPSISRSTGISKTTCMHYLRDTEIQQPAEVNEQEWKNAEQLAKGYLEQRGFRDIHDLNAISPSSYWDLLARRKGKWWLVDVTVSATKSIGAKLPFAIKGYIHAILYRNLTTKEWTFVRVTLEPVKD